MITRSQIEEAAQRRAAAAAAAATVAEYRATRTPKFTIRKPTPDMYGIWDGFDFDEYDVEERTFKRRRFIGVAVVYLFLGAMVTVISSAIFGDGGVTIEKLNSYFLCYIFFGTPLLIVAYNKANIEHY